MSRTQSPSSCEPVPSTQSWSHTGSRAAAPLSSTVQRDDPAADVAPWGHAMQRYASFPRPLLYVPAGQATQAELSAAINVPAVQLHCAALAAPSGAMDPQGHNVHEVDAAT